MKRIINHKRVEMTNEEFEMYQAICKSYDRPNFKGEELFIDLFETNSDGIITFVRPADKRQFSMEVYCFMLSVMVNQHLRVSHETVQALVSETKVNVENIAKYSNDKIAELESRLAILESGK